MQAVEQSQGISVSSQDCGIDSVLTDAVLSELKKQATNGCLLCSFDAWEGEEWE